MKNFKLFTEEDMIKEAYSPHIMKNFSKEQRKNLSKILNKDLKVDINTLDQSDFEPIKSARDKRLKDSNQIILMSIPAGTGYVTQDYGYTNPDSVCVFRLGKFYSNDETFLKGMNLKKALGIADSIALIRISDKDGNQRITRSNQKHGSTAYNLDKKKNEEIAELKARISRYDAKVKNSEQAIDEWKKSDNRDKQWNIDRHKEVINSYTPSLTATKNDLASVKKDPYKYFMGGALAKRFKTYKNQKNRDVNVESKMLEVMRITLDAKKLLEAKAPIEIGTTRSQEEWDYSKNRSALARYVADMNSDISRLIEYDLNVINATSDHDKEYNRKEKANRNIYLNDAINKVRQVMAQF